MAKQKEKENHSSKPNPKSGLKAPSSNPFLKYTGMGFQMIATILLGVWLGRFLDGHFETSFPAFTAGLSLFSVIAAMYLGVKELLK